LLKGKIKYTYVQFQGALNSSGGLLEGEKGFINGIWFELEGGLPVEDLVEREQKMRGSVDGPGSGSR